MTASRLSHSDSDHLEATASRTDGAAPLKVLDPKTVPPTPAAIRHPSWPIGYRRRIAVTDVVIIALVVFSSQALRIGQAAQLKVDGFGSVAIVSYLASAEVARSYLAIALPLGLFGLMGGRWVWRRLLEEYRLAGSHMSAVLVVGGTNSAIALAARLRSAPAAGFQVVGLCLPGGPAAWIEHDTMSDHAFPVVGDLDDVFG